MKNKSRYGTSWVSGDKIRFSEKKKIIKKFSQYSDKLINLDSKAERALNSAIRAINVHSNSKGKKEKLKASRLKLDRAFNRLLKYEYTDEWGRKKEFITSKTIDNKKFYSVSRKIGISANNGFNTSSIYSYETFKATMDADKHQIKTTKSGKARKSLIQQIIDYKDAFLFGGYGDWVERVRRFFNIDDTVSDLKFEKWIEKYIMEEME